MSFQQLFRQCVLQLFVYHVRFTGCKQVPEMKHTGAAVNVDPGFIRGPGFRVDPEEMSVAQNRGIALENDRVFPILVMGQFSRFFRDPFRLPYDFFR